MSSPDSPICPTQAQDGAARPDPVDSANPTDPAAAPSRGQPGPPIVPFKDRVIGVAKKTRGTLLSKPELKEHGEKILQGEATIYNPNEQPRVESG
ncbi:hypothetical protein GGX14DRAFT_563429 [Mycena pura]|uniref:Uncharacterized protein n=1 Tax=Mycena pura TaxID=153505 RepID=A0AAD6VMA7_9AGAR|nr:hypothetical protein GGX14DRAFT_563429 [Mycena pura]